MTFFPTFISCSESDSSIDFSIPLPHRSGMLYEHMAHVFVSVWELFSVVALCHRRKFGFWTSVECTPRKLRRAVMVNINSHSPKKTCAIFPYSLGNLRTSIWILSNGVFRPQPLWKPKVSPNTKQCSCNWPMNTGPSMLSNCKNFLMPAYPMVSTSFNILKSWCFSWSLNLSKSYSSQCIKSQEVF